MRIMYAVPVPELPPEGKPFGPAPSEGWRQLQTAVAQARLYPDQWYRFVPTVPVTRNNKNQWALRLRQKGVDSVTRGDDVYFRVGGSDEAS
jgi:hypothetical protein